VLAYFLGRSERRRLLASGRTLERVAESLRAKSVQPVPVGAGFGGSAGTGPVGDGDHRQVDDAAHADIVRSLDSNRSTVRPKPIWFNLGLTVALLTLLGLDILPLALVFVAATAVALVVNFPKQDDQVAAIKSHASSIVSVVAMVFAAAVLVGVLSGTGMVSAMANGIVAAVPASLGPWFAVMSAARVGCHLGSSPWWGRSCPRGPGIRFRGRRRVTIGASEGEPACGRRSWRSSSRCAWRWPRVAPTDRSR
jgi:CitMHS family citrate-Mg2+:H+ or citrate-Ca2+:H+ symporter